MCKIEKTHVVNITKIWFKWVWNSKLTVKEAWTCRLLERNMKEYLFTSESPLLVSFIMSTNVNKDPKACSAMFWSYESCDSENIPDEIHVLWNSNFSRFLTDDMQQSFRISNPCLIPKFCSAHLETVFVYLTLRNWFHLTRRTKAHALDRCAWRHK